MNVAVDLRQCKQVKDESVIASRFDSVETSAGFTSATLKPPFMPQDIWNHLVSELSHLRIFPTRRITTADRKHDRQTKHSRATTRLEIGSPKTDIHLLIRPYTHISPTHSTPQPHCRPCLQLHRSLFRLIALIRSVLSSAKQQVQH